MGIKSEARARQGYRTKHQACRDCRHYRCRTHYHSYGDVTYETYYYQRCGLGGFAVARLATCNEFAPKETHND